MKKAVKMWIRGSVQGVFFRNFVKEEADKRTIKGYVRNLDNGEVEAWFEGSNKAVDDILNKVKIGPPHSQIREIEIEENKFHGFKEFKILRI